MRKIRAEQRPSKQRHESDLVPNEEITECTQQKIQGWAAPTAGKIDEKIRARKKNHQNKLRLDLEWSRWHTSPRKQTKTRTQEGSHPAAQKPNKKKEHKKKNSKLHKTKCNPDFSLKSHDIHIITEFTALPSSFN
jgi:hypothetical protein